MIATVDQLHTLQRAITDEYKSKFLLADGEINNLKEQVEDLTCKLSTQNTEQAQNQKDYKESIKKLEEQLAMNQQQLNGDRARVEAKQESLDMVSAVVELQKSLQNEINSRKAAEEELNSLKNELVQWRSSMAVGNAEVLKLRKLLEDDKHQKEELEEEITELRKFEAIGNAEVLKLRKSLIDLKRQKETLEEEITGLEKFEAVRSAEVLTLRQLLEDEKHQKEKLEEEITGLRKFEAVGSAEILELRKLLKDEKHQKENLEEEIAGLTSQLLQRSFEADEEKSGAKSKEGNNEKMGDDGCDLATFEADTDKSGNALHTISEDVEKLGNSNDATLSPVLDSGNSNDASLSPVVASCTTRRHTHGKRDFPRLSREAKSLGICVGTSPSPVSEPCTNPRNTCGVERKRTTTGPITCSMAKANTRMGSHVSDIANETEIMEKSGAKSKEGNKEKMGDDGCDVATFEADTDKSRSELPTISEYVEKSGNSNDASLSPVLDSGDSNDASPSRVLASCTTRRHTRCKRDLPQLSREAKSSGICVGTSPSPVSEPFTNPRYTCGMERKRTSTGPIIRSMASHASDIAKKTEMMESKMRKRKPVENDVTSSFKIPKLDSSTMRPNTSRVRRHGLKAESSGSQASRNAKKPEMKESTTRKRKPIPDAPMLPTSRVKVPKLKNASSPAQ